MALCAERGAIFIGQGVTGGTTMTQTFVKVPAAQKLEYPVAEEMQTGHCLGASLVGVLPICVFPRWNFAVVAANQIINHLDRLPLYSDYRPKVIIRTAIPSTEPFNPGPQHDDDFTGAFVDMARTIKVVRLGKAEHIIPAYRVALDSDGSTILAEFTEHYKNARAGGG